MSVLEAIVDKVERAISFSDRTKSLDSILSNEKSVLSEFSGEDSRAGSVTNGFKAGEFFLPNGESYSGSLLGSKPEGLGKYAWSDGSEYEGEWRHGIRQGYGKLQWPSGALYEGEFSGDYMHGSGTYTRPDGMTYKGRWRLNLKHGLGYQNYPNRDVFEGSWMRGTPEGPGKYTWANGNVYLGNMKGGKMSGKGTLNWINGDSFEGNWLNGMIHGFGVYTWADGGCYVGSWTRGLKDGKGTFYPKGSSLPAGQQLYLHALRKKGLLPDLRKQNQVSHINHATSVDMGDVEVGGIQHSVWNSSDNLSKGLLNLEHSHTTNVSLKRTWSLEVSIEKVIGHYRSSSTSDTVLDGGDNGISINHPPILEREYIQGVLISELVLSDRFSPLSRRTNRRQKRLAREIKRPGEQIIKGHRSYDLMLSLQLGIRYTVGKITPIPSREVRATDFGSSASFWMNFPREGSQLTPPHRSDDFKWKDYCPMVFRNLREMFDIDAADYMMSICGNDALRELSSPGKSGSVFFLSQDDRFMIKTLRKSEVKVLLRMLPNYYRHVCTYDNTLITKFFGLHRIKPSSGQKFRFVVMGNMFCTELRIHRRFDLKGSRLGRSADKVEIDENTILKDLDLNYCFYLQPSWQNVLLQQIEIDSKFLESENIMDYSLLLGVHHRAPQHLRSRLSYSQRISVDGLGIVAENEPMEDEITPQGLVLVPRGADDKDVVIGSHIRGNHLRTPQHLRSRLSYSQRISVDGLGIVAENESTEDEITSQGLVLVPRGADDKDVVIGSHIRGNRLRASSASGNKEVDLLLPGTARLQIQLGVNMPARAEHISRGDDARIFHEAYDVVLYLGIIDILQEYNMTKKIEHAYKSIHFDPLWISAVDPKFYSQRFLEFIQKVFPPNAVRG